MPVGKVGFVSNGPAARRDPLDHWLEQEGSADLPSAFADEERARAALPSGWWIVPTVLLALPLWAMLIWAAFGG
ncbi:MAG TPA: hypothetical protein PK450_03440 [Paracoccaceae bacterium]|nr:hypothetical protein [Paracoccaceae bacterium]